MLKRFSLLVMVAVFLTSIVGGAAMAQLGTPTKISNPNTVQAPWCDNQVKTRDPDGINWRTLPVHGDRWNSYIWSMCCLEDCKTGQNYLWAGTNRNIIYRLLLEVYFGGLKGCGVPLHAFDYAIEKLFCGNVPTGGQGCDEDLCKDFAAEIWRWPIAQDSTYKDWNMVYKSSCKDWPDEDCCDSCCCPPECDTCPHWNWECDPAYCWRFGPDWGFRTCITHSYCGPGGQEVDNIYFGNFKGCMCTEATRIVGFDFNWEKGVPPETVFCDDGDSLRAMATYTNPCNGETFMVVGTEDRKIYIDNEPDYPCQCCDPEQCTEEWCGIANGEDLGGWKRISNGDIWDMVEYNGFLYVVVAAKDGFRLYRGWPDNDACDDCCCCEWEWEEIVGGHECPDPQFNDEMDGVYPSGMGRRSAVAANLAVCDDCVYLGTQIDLFGIAEDFIDEDICDGRGMAVSENDVKEAANMLALENRTDLNAEDVAKVFKFMLGTEAEVNAEAIKSKMFNGGKAFIGNILHEMIIALEKCPTQVYRFCKDSCLDPDGWDLIVGNGSDEMGSQYFESSLSGRWDGFGIEKPSKWNTYSWELECCDGKLYVSTFDARSLFAGLTECWCDTSCPSWTLLECAPKLREKLICLCNWVHDRVDAQAGPVTPGSVSNPAGFDLFEIDPSTSAVTTVMDNGFDDYLPDQDDNGGGNGKYNIGGPSMACCDGCLYVGTANPFWGGQVWKVCDDEASCMPRDFSKSGVLNIEVAGTNDIWTGWNVDGKTCCPNAQGTESFSVDILSGDGYAVSGDPYALFFEFEENNTCAMKLCATLSACPESQSVPVITMYSWDGFTWISRDAVFSWIENDDAYIGCVDIPYDSGTLIDVLSEQVHLFVDSSVDTGDLPVINSGNGNGDEEPSPGGDTTTSSSGSSGCNAGPFSAAALLILLPIGFFWRKF